MGNIAGSAQAPPLPKSQLVRILKRARKLAMRKLLAMKQENIQARLPFYKVDAQKYRDCVFGLISAQQKMCQDTVIEICSEQNVSIGSLSAGMRTHMIDPEVHQLIVSFQTMSGDLCENYPVPEEYDIEKLKEGLRIQIRELSGYPINDGATSILAQIAVSDEVFNVLGIDEITFGALAIKYEKSGDPELAQLKEDWNKASKFDLTMMGAH
jgi:hypothetical protein